MNVFKLEEYLTKHEFTAKYLLCCSDAQSFAMAELVSMAGGKDKELWDKLTLGYTEPYGHPALRQRIAALYPGLSAEHILCFAGAQEGIFCALTTLIEPQDHVVVITPCYQSLFEVPRAKGADITQIALREENAWRIDLDAVKSALRPTTKCVIVNFPHNPTGQIITEEELKGLIDLCAARGIWLFCDEVYRLLGQTDSAPHAPPAASLYDKALSLGVMSKAFGMAGLRVGWIACKNKDIIHKMKLMKDYVSICNSAPSEILSMIALDHKETILARNNKIVAQNLKLLDIFLGDHAHLFEWVRPQGGCVGFVKYKGKDGVDAFCARLIEKQNVLLMPASVYDFPGNYFRIGFGRVNMPACLEQLHAFLEAEHV
ncbi:MAG: aminotransferase [Candidatus Puniceispirillum sp.]|nr:aminotransferase [Candidatus Puniceispirillum sp.]